jgi:peptide/nickel transport system permease protein
LSNKTYQEWLDQLNLVYKLNVGIIPGFFGWLGNAVKGDFGDSWHYGIPVTEKFSQVIWYSVIINITTFFVEIFIAIPLGILAARKQYSKTDYAITVFALAGISLPTFFLATILKYIFSIKLGWFDLYGLTGRFYTSMTPFQQVMDIGYHMVLPIVTLTMLSIGGLMRYTRTNMLEVLNSDYIRTARAKGLSEKDSTCFLHELPATLHVWWLAYHGNTLPDTGHWLCILSSHHPRRHTIRHVLFNISHRPNSGQSHRCGYYLRNGRPAC